MAKIKIYVSVSERPKQKLDLSSIESQPKKVVVAVVVVVVVVFVDQVWLKSGQYQKHTSLISIVSNPIFIVVMVVVTVVVVQTSPPSARVAAMSDMRN